MKLQKKILVFDFDGTIADTLKIALLIVNEIGEDYGWPKLDKAGFVEYKKKSLRELMDMVGLKYRHLPRIVRKSRNGFKRHMNQVKPIAGIPEVLKQLKDRGYILGILTSNTRKNVQKFLETHELELFDFIYAPNSLYGKAPVLKKIRRKYRTSMEDIVMIGDEHRDLDAANQAGVDGLAVLWGFHENQQLEEAKPVYIATKPDELLTLFP
ncbi:MAG: HAD-IA family hydrolase [Bacteroidia bacterium]|nr:HAD-IA family hydrolase [Bacteroidia bacterium]